MSVKFRLEGGGQGPVASVVEHARHDPGVVAYTHPLDHYRYAIQPLASDDFGINMAINPAAVAPTLTLIHNGLDSEGWTGSNVSGAGFVFDSTAQANSGTQSIDATDSTNNNRASLVAPVPINPTDFSSLKFAIYIAAFSSQGTKDVTLQFFSQGAPVGTELSIKPYVNTLSFNSWQVADVPMGDFGLQGVVAVDELQIRTVDSGAGAAPDYYLDDINLVQVTTGSGVASYKFVPENGQDYSLVRLRVSAYNSAAAGLDPTKFFGVAQLSGGFELVLRTKRRVLLSLVARDLWDLQRAPNCVLTQVSDGASGSYYYADFAIPVEHLLLNGSEGTSIEVRIKDDLTGLTRLETSLHLAQLDLERP